MNYDINRSRNIKHIVDGIPLYRWCIEKGYPYTAAVQMIQRGLSITQMKQRLQDLYYSLEDLSKNILQASYYYANEYPGASRERRLEIRSEFTSIYGQHRLFESHWERIVTGITSYYSSMDYELWKRLPGDDKLEVSNQGNFRRCDIHGYCRKVKAYLCLKKNKSGVRERKYLAINARGCEARRAARIVAEVWVPNPYNKQVVHQIDGEYSNIHPSNLKWVSKAMHGMTTGYSPKRSKPVELIDTDGAVIEKFDSVRDAAKELNLTYQTISNYCKKKVKKNLYQLRFSKNVSFINSELFKKKYQPSMVQS